MGTERNKKEFYCLVPIKWSDEIKEFIESVAHIEYYDNFKIYRINEVEYFEKL